LEEFVSAGGAVVDFGVGGGKSDSKAATEWVGGIVTSHKAGSVRLEDKTNSRCGKRIMNDLMDDGSAEKGWVCRTWLEIEFTQVDGLMRQIEGR
jgi:hypothetical protein